MCADARALTAVVFRRPIPARRAVSVRPADGHGDGRGQPRPQQPVVPTGVDAAQAAVEAGDAVPLTQRVDDVPRAGRQGDELRAQRRADRDRDREHHGRPEVQGSVGPPLRRIAVHQPEGQGLVGEGEGAASPRRATAARGITRHRVRRQGERHPGERHRQVVRRAPQPRDTPGGGRLGGDVDHQGPPRMVHERPSHRRSCGAAVGRQRHPDAEWVPSRPWETLVT